MKFNYPWHFLSNLGNVESLNREEKKRLIFSNRLAVILFMLVLGVHTYASIRAGRIVVGPSIASIGLLSIVSLVLNHFRLFLLAKNVLSIAPIITLFAYPILSGRVNSAHFIWLPYAAVIFSVIPLILFNSNKEKAFQIVHGAIFLLLILFIDQLLLFGGDPSLVPQTYDQYFVTLKLTHFVFWGFINSAFFSLMVVNGSMERRLDQFNKMLQDKNEEILAQSEEILIQYNELIEKQEEIETINQNLEMILNERTRVIEERNAQIIEYAYFNAHQVRGPLARIMGIVNISRHAANETELHDMFNRMDEAANELNRVVLQLNKILEDESGTESNAKNLSS